MSIGEDDAEFGVDHETGGHLIGGFLGVECARHPNAQNDDRRLDILERRLPDVLMHGFIGYRWAASYNFV